MSRVKTLKAWVAAVMRENEVTPEPGEIANFARGVLLMEQIAETEPDPGVQARILHDARVYVSHIGETAPHLDLDVPALPPPDLAVTRSENQRFAEAS